MKQATLEQLQCALSEFIALVRAGETVEITEDGKAVALIMPAPVPETDEERIERLVRAGVLCRPLLPPLRPEELPEPVPITGVLDALLAEREEGW